MVRTRKSKRPLPRAARQPMMLMFGDIQSIQLESMIRKLKLDDALVQRAWRLEYVFLEEGFAHYRLLYGKRVVGIRDVTSRQMLPLIHRGLAAYLAQCGVRADKAKHVIFGARTPLDEAKHRVQPLFMFIGEQRKGRRAADEVHVYSLSI